VTAELPHPPSEPSGPPRPGGPDEPDGPGGPDDDAPRRASFPELPRSVFERLPHPLVQAPMAGGISVPALVAAVSGAGGLGFLAAGYQEPRAVREEIAMVRALTGAPFGVNVFVPGHDVPGAAEAVAAYREHLAGEAERYDVALPDAPAWDDDAYAEKLDLLTELAVPVVSFTFGCPDEDTVARLQSAGSEIAVTVTTPDEALRAVRAGADALCVQSAAAGGHRGSFEPRPVGEAAAPEPSLTELLTAVREAVAGEGAELPLLAAGGIMDGADVAAVLAAGATAAQLGTAFLATPESGAHPLHKAALTDRRWSPHGSFGNSTGVTRAFSGRPARGLVNRFMTEHQAYAPACYPQVHRLVAPLRRAAAQAGDVDGMALWAGTGHARARALPAQDLVELLLAEAAQAAGLPPDRRV